MDTTQITPTLATPVLAMRSDSDADKYLRSGIDQVACLLDAVRIAEEHMAAFPAISAAVRAEHAPGPARVSALNAAGLPGHHAKHAVIRLVTLISSGHPAYANAMAKIEAEYPDLADRCDAVENFKFLP
jgi:hypothetical protein